MMKKNRFLFQILFVTAFVLMGLEASAQLVDRVTFEQHRAAAMSLTTASKTAANTAPITLTQNPYEIDEFYIGSDATYEVKVYFNTAVMAAYRSECCPRITEFELALPDGFSVTSVKRGNALLQSPITVTGTFDDVTQTLSFLGYGVCSAAQLAQLPTGRIHYATITITASNATIGDYLMNMIEARFAMANEPSEFTISGTSIFPFSCVQLATGITLSHSSISIGVGESFTLSANVFPSTAANKRVMWNSSNTSIATVVNGVVRGVVEGECIITATTLDGSNLSASCLVTVTQGGSQLGNNYLIAEDNSNIVAGQEFVIPVELVNADPITAIQTELYLPNGIVPDYDENNEFVFLEPSRKGRGHTVSTTVNDVATRIMASSSRNAAFQGNDGTVMYIYLKANEGLPTGMYGIDLKNIILSTTTGEMIEAPNVKINIGVATYHSGDANGDGFIDDADYVITANYIMARNPNNFIFNAADMSGDGRVYVNDLPLIIDAAMAFDFGANNAPRRKPAKTAANNKLYVSDFDMEASRSKTLSLKLKNATTFTAVQCDINLPTGMSVVQQTDEWGDPTYITLVETRINEHDAWSDLTSNGNVRVIITNSNSKVLKGNSGAVATFKVKTNAAFSGEHQLVLKNIVCVDEDAVRYALPDAVCYINKSATMPGDVDGNGEVNGTDLNILINIILGNDSADNYDGRANVDGQGGVDGSDINALINILLGK